MLTKQVFYGFSSWETKRHILWKQVRYLLDLYIEKNIKIGNILIHSGMKSNCPLCSLCISSVYSHFMLCFTILWCAMVCDLYYMLWDFNARLWDLYAMGNWDERPNDMVSYSMLRDLNKKRIRIQFQAFRSKIKNKPKFTTNLQCTSKHNF